MKKLLRKEIWFFNHFRALSAEFLCFCWNFLTRLWKLKFTCPKKHSFENDFFWEDGEIFSNSSDIEQNFFDRRSKTFRRDLKPGLWVSIRNILKKKSFSGKVVANSPFRISSETLFMPFVGKISLGLSNLNLYIYGILLREQNSLKCLFLTFSDIERAISVLSSIFFNGVFRIAF